MYLYVRKMVLFFFNKFNINMKFSKKGLLMTDIEFRTHYTEAKLAGFSVCFFGTGDRTV